jgi:hypothetical protein
MIHHGASHIFSGKELTDTDIDKLLESGEQRTMEQRRSCSTRSRM